MNTPTPPTPRIVITPALWAQHKAMVDNVRKMRATVHQFVTHPEVDAVSDAKVLEMLAAYRAVVTSLVDVTMQLHDIATKRIGSPGLHPAREHDLRKLLVGLRDGTF